jgi:hypothetical protein
MNVSIAVLSRAIVAELSPDLLAPRYKRVKNANKFTGHCYVASEALFHFLGGSASGLVPQVLRHEGGTHWYLKETAKSRIRDLTAAQFKTTPPYAQGRGCGFLTRKPSKRCALLMDRVRIRLSAKKK